MGIKFLILLLALACSNLIHAQDTPALSASDAAKVDRLSQQYVAAVSKKSDEVSKDIDKATQQYLERLQKQELKLQKKLAKVDSVKAHNVFANSAAKYQQLQNDIQNRTQRLQRSTGLYLPFTDTAANSLKFLSTNPLGGKLPINPALLKDALGKVNNLEAQLRQCENVKEFIHQRKEYLKQQLAGDNMGADLKKYSATGYYYCQQVNDYKKALSDPTKAEQKALALLRQYGPFQKFMSKNGALASLFNAPTDYANSGVTGMQTLGQVQSLLQSQIKAMGPGGLQAVQASLSSAQSELAQLRNRLLSTGNPNDMPDFQPQQTKTMPLWKKIIYGFDMTTTKSNAILPAYTDFAVTIGLKLNNRFTAGIGSSYKLGYGQDIRHIHFSSQGIGLRSYVDWKWKKNWFLSGGGEANYLTAFSTIKELQNYSAWKPSALLGISRTISLKSKWVKNTKVSVFYDFLHAWNQPNTQAVVFRYGYNF